MRNQPLYGASQISLNAGEPPQTGSKGRVRGCTGSQGLIPGIPVTRTYRAGTELIVQKEAKNYRLWPQGPAIHSCQPRITYKAYNESKMGHYSITPTLEV